MDQTMEAAIRRLELDHPTYRDKVLDPYRIPGRPAEWNMLDYLKTRASDDVKAYCRSGIEWTRKYPQWALPGFRRLVREIE